MCQKKWKRSKSRDFTVTGHWSQLEFQRKVRRWRQLEMFSNSCNQVVDHTRKSSIDTHFDSKKHNNHKRKWKQSKEKSTKRQVDVCVWLCGCLRVCVCVCTCVDTCMRLCMVCGFAWLMVSACLRTNRGNDGISEVLPNGHVKCLYGFYYPYHQPVCLDGRGIASCHREFLLPPSLCPAHCLSAFQAAIFGFIVYLLWAIWLFFQNHFECAVRSSPY